MNVIQSVNQAANPGNVGQSGLSDFLAFQVEYFHRRPAGSHIDPGST
jgi:hypothetical protein